MQGFIEAQVAAIPLGCVSTVYDFSEAHHLLFSAGRSLSGPTDFQCYLAYRFTFDTASSTSVNTRRSRVPQAEPIRTPTMNTSTPPTTTWNVALRSGVSM